MSTCNNYKVLVSVTKWRYWSLRRVAKRLTAMKSRPAQALLSPMTASLSGCKEQSH